MKPTLLKTMLVCGLSIACGSNSLFARGGQSGEHTQATHSGGGAVSNVHPQHNAGINQSNAGSNQQFSPHIQQNVTHQNVQHQIQQNQVQQNFQHNPGLGVQQNLAVGLPQSQQVTHQIHQNHLNLNQQNLGVQNVITGSPQIGVHQKFDHKGIGNTGLSNQLIQSQAGLVGNTNLIHNQNHNGQHHGLNGIQQGNFSGINQVGIAHQQFVGNKVNFGNRQLYIGNQNYLPSYCSHPQYYHGYWNGNYGYGGYGGYGWGPGIGFGYYGYRPYFWGLGGWGLGSLVYGSGYSGYYNPYYYGNNGTTVVYNYSQPIPVAYNGSSSGLIASNGFGTDPSIQSTAPASSSVMNSAVAAFKQNDYDGALNILNQGITQYPDDAVLHEFRGLVLFAKGDYKQAAATVHSVLAVGPGWDWTTLSGLYADIGLYTLQLRSLEATVKQNQQDAAARFLLAYHYMSDGYPDAAAKQLQQVVALVPNDQVASNLLKMMSTPNAPVSNGTVAQPSPQPPVELPSPTQTPVVAVDPATMVGNWTASRDDGSNFTLNIMNDKTFSWTFTPKQQPPQSFDGTYTVEGNVIALERTGGGSLVATISSNDGSRFNFKVVGAPNEDPGLNFTR